MDKQPSFDAFISYGRADSKSFAIKLTEKLTSLGLKVWFDQEDIPLAVDYQEQINDGIEKAHNFIFIISPHSINSPYCLKEIKLAIEHNKRIIPLLHVEEISYETWQERNPNQTEGDWKEYKERGLHSSYDNMHPTISKINWVYFRENLDDYESSFTGLWETIDRQKDYVEKHTDLLVKALDWERNQKQTNYLLVGEERQEASAWLTEKFVEQPPCIPTDLHCEFISESTKNANNLMTQVFIAYSEVDQGIKEKIRKTLMRESFTIWTNKTDIKTGIIFQEAINQGIEGADNFLYLISKDSLESPYCQQELAHAFANNKRIIPLLIEDNLKIPPTPLDKGGKTPISLASPTGGGTIDNEIHDQLRELQFIDLTDYEDAHKYQQGVDRLLAQLKKDASYYEKHKSLLVQALKWLRQKHNPSLLLRGYNRQQFEAWLKVAKLRDDYPPLPLQEEFITASLNQPEASSLEVFISYSRTDSDLARKLNDKLQELGKTTWFDQESIATGMDFQQEIYRGIESSDNFLFIISPKSVNSPYCADEVAYARKLGKRFVTILHRKLSAEDKHNFPLALANVQYLNFNQHGREFAANFNELVRTLDTDRNHVVNHTKWSQRALEWQEKGGEERLLRGSELAIAENWLGEAEKNKKQPPATDLQKQFIGASLNLRNYITQAKAKRRRRDLRTAWGIAGGSLLAVIISTGLWLETKVQKKRAELNLADSFAHSSLYLSAKHKQLDAFVKAIKAGKILQKQKESNQEVTGILLESIYQGKERNRLQRHEDSVRSISLSPDGKRLASGSDDTTIRLWDLRTGKEIHTLQGHNDTVTSISFSPDGKTLISSSVDKTIKLWDLETGKEISTIQAHDDWVWSISFSNDGKTFASSSRDKTIKLWDLETGKEISTIQAHDEWVYSISFSPDGKALASGSVDKTIKLWDLKTGKEILTLQGHDGPIRSVSFSNDGKTLASGSDDKTIKLWNLKIGEEIKTLAGHDGSILNANFSPDGRTLASGSMDKTIKLWDLETGEEISTLKGHDEWVYSVNFSPDGKTLVSGSEDKTIKLWNLETKEILSLPTQDKPVISISFNPDGKTLVSGSRDGSIKLWNLETGEEIPTFKRHNEPVFSLSFRRDGKILASGSEDKNIKLWDLKTGKKILTLKKQKDDPAISISFSFDGQTLASGSRDGSIKLWNLQTRKVIATLKGHDDPVFSLSFSPDNQTLASGSVDGSIKLWSLKEEKEIVTFQAHLGWVNSLDFSPDGNTLASGSNDKNIKLWDLKDLNTKKEIKEIVTFQGHNDLVNSLHFSQDGKILASGGRDGTIKLWDLDFDSLIENSCNEVRNYLKYNPNIKEEDRLLCDRIDHNQNGILAKITESFRKPFLGKFSKSP